MAHIVEDNVRESSTTTGTGSFSLGGALNTGRTFSSVCADADTVHYAIHHETLNEWEIGLGTYETTGNLLLRTTPLESSNAGAAVNFSAGNKRVELVLPAFQALFLRQMTQLTGFVRVDAGVPSVGANFTSGAAGLVPASGGGTANFLRADGTFAAPAGGGFTHTFVTATPSANQLAWSIPGRTAYTTVRATPADASFLGGVSGGASGDVLNIINASASGLLWLINEDATDVAANRFSLARSGVYLLPGASLSLTYDATSSRWRQTAKNRDFFDVDGKSLLVVPGATTAVSAMGGTVSTTATISTIAPTGTPTNDFAEDAAIQITNATASGSSDVRAANLNFMRGATTGRQGVAMHGRVRFTALGATGSVALMMTSSTTAITTQARSTNNTFGIGAHGGETTLRVWSRDAAAATAVDLGANFPVPSATAAYDVLMFAPSNTAAIRYMVRRLDSDQRTSGNLTANLPSNTTVLGPRIGIMVGATATASTMQATRFVARSAS